MKIKSITIKWVFLIATIVIMAFYLYINYFSPIDLTGETRGQTSQKLQSANTKLAKLAAAELSMQLLNQ